MIPLVYPKDMDVAYFKEFRDAEKEAKKKQGRKQERKDVEQASRAADDSISQSSLGETRADMKSVIGDKKRMSTVSEQIGGIKQLQETRFVKQSTMSTKAGIDTITEDHVVDKDDSNFVNIKDQQRDVNKDLITDGVSPKGSQSPRKKEKAKKKTPIKQQKWVYNPYASEPIMHCEDLSRAEIAQLMEIRAAKIEEEKLRKESKAKK